MGFVSFDYKGRFIRGTGKFKDIKALWKFKGKGKKGEWEVQYY